MYTDKHAYQYTYAHTDAQVYTHADKGNTCTSTQLHTQRETHAYAHWCTQRTCIQMHTLVYRWTCSHLCSQMSAHGHTLWEHGWIRTHTVWKHRWTRDLGICSALLRPSQFLLSSLLSFSCSTNDLKGWVVTSCSHEPIKDRSMAIYLFWEPRKRP